MVATGLLDHAMGDEPEVQVESHVAVVDVESRDFANPVEPVVEGGSVDVHRRGGGGP